MMTNEKIV